MDEVQQLLASGSVDELRKLLKREGGGTTEASERSMTEHVRHASNTLFSSRRSIKFVVNDTVGLQLCDHRTMGKLVWPAGHAVASLFARLPWSAANFSVVEVGAGAGAPSLVAAHLGARTIATDFTEECVELLRHNDEMNGSRLTATARLDVNEHTALLELVRQHGLTDNMPVMIVACDCSYDPKTVADIFASCGLLLVRPSAPIPLVCFARADTFAHLDEHATTMARSNGFELAVRTTHRAAGVLDAVSETYLTPCAEDVVDCLFFVRAGDAKALQPHPFLEVLRKHGGRANCASTCEAQGSLEPARAAAFADVWGPQEVGWSITPFGDSLAAIDDSQL